MYVEHTNILSDDQKSLNFKFDKYSFVYILYSRSYFRTLFMNNISHNLRKYNKQILSLTRRIFINNLRSNVLLTDAQVLQIHTVGRVFYLKLHNFSSIQVEAHIIEGKFSVHSISSIIEFQANKQLRNEQNEFRQWTHNTGNDLPKNRHFFLL